MNLDFSKLSAPAKNSGGQRGTPGTPILARVPASPSASHQRGTAGDKRGTAANSPEVLARSTGVCPPVSPSCPPARGTLKPNTGAVSHLSPSVPLKNSQDRVSKETGANLLRDPDGGASFTPYCVPLPADRVAAMLAEIREAIGTLADAEGWPADYLAHLLALVARQPAFTLADDLTYFRERLASLRAAGAAAGAVNLVRTCGTCAYRAEYGHGARWRCVVARAMDWRHHAWLDAPEQVNDCWYYERKKR